MSTIVWPYEQDMYHAQVQVISTRFDEATFALLWKQGEQLSQEALLAIQEQGELPTALTDIPLPYIGSPLSSNGLTAVPKPQSVLTARESEVLRLLAEGNTDHQIAERLVISPRTVNTHLTSLYRTRLGLSHVSGNKWHREDT